MVEEPLVNVRIEVSDPYAPPSTGLGDPTVVYPIETPRVTRSFGSRSAREVEEVPSRLPALVGGVLD
jgi:hypothetical protein